MDTTDCPPNERLQQLLDDRLEAIEADRVVAHVGACPACQQVLEELTAAADSFRDRLRVLPEEPTPLPGSRLRKQPWPELPGYEVLGLLGQGGMAVVWKARDRSLGRLVALKMVRDDGAGNPEQVQRFRQEAVLLARLRHPNIVQVYEVGEQDGVPFFALEYIEGGSLAQQLTGQPLPAELAAALVEKLARAVQAAHRAGVVHRDLKPGNILLQSPDGAVPISSPTGAGTAPGPTVLAGEAALRRLRESVPKVSDFGLAKPLQTGDGLTTTGALMGTPEYMAPEQAQGRGREAGPACDIHALGAILYRLLTGRPPFVAETTAELLLQVAHEEPLPPRRLWSKIPHDLETVCLKCLEKEAARRYASAEALADDLARFQRGESVQARRTSLPRRGLKWARRRPAAAALLGACALLLGLASGGGVWYQGARAEQAQREVQRAERARATERDVMAALQEAGTLGKQARGLKGNPDQWQLTLARALSAVQRAQGLADSGEASDELLEAIRQVRAELDKAERDRALIAELEDIRLKFINPGEGGLDKARAAQRYTAAFRGYGIDLLALEPRDAAERLKAKRLLEDLLAAVGEWSRIAPDKAESQRLAEVLAAGDPDPQSFRNRWRAAVARPDNTALEELVVEGPKLGVPTAYLVNVARGLRSRGAKATALRLLSEAHWRHPEDFWLNFELALSYHGLDPSRPEEATGYLRAALAVRRIPVVLSNLGVVLQKQDRLDEAIRYHREALALDREYVPAYHNLSAALLDKGQVDEALHCARTAVALDPRDSRGPEHLGNALRAQGRLEEAIRWHQRAVELEPGSVSAHNNLGCALRAQGRLDEAIRSYHRALELEPRRAVIYTNLGNTLRDLGQLGQTVCYHLRAIELNPGFAPAYTSLGNALKDQGRLEEAVRCYRRAVELDPQHTRSLTNLGAALHLLGRTGEAIAYLRQAIELDPKHATAHGNLGTALKAQGLLEEAIRCYRTAIDLDPRYALVHHNLGAALLDKGRWEEALVSLRHARKLFPPTSAHLAVTQQLIRKTEQFLALDWKLPAILEGKAEPADAAERLGLARLCQEHKRYYAAAARFYTEALAAEPRLAEDLAAGYRYDAACVAALAAAGAGTDSGGLDREERARLRGQGLVWLRADLEASTQRLGSGKAADRTLVEQRLRHWQKDPDLESVRNPAALARLAAEERKGWQQLWADVEVLLATGRVKE